MQMEDTGGSILNWEVGMTGVEVVVACLAAWAVRKAQRVAKRADVQVDEILDSSLDRLHETVKRKLGADPALDRLEIEAAEGALSARTEQRVALALAEATDQDEEFGRAIDVLVEEIERRRPDITRPSAGHQANGNLNSTVIQAGGDVSGNTVR